VQHKIDSARRDAVNVATRLDYTRRALGERSTLYTEDVLLPIPLALGAEPMPKPPRSSRFDVLVEVCTQPRVYAAHSVAL
jgi:hypothetical protein